MKTARWPILVMILAMVWLGGCSTINDVAASKESGVSAVYSVTAEQAWDIAKTVFRWEGTGAIEEHLNDGYMLTSSGMNLVSMGAVMAAWIDPVDQNNTKVTILTKRRVATNVATTLTEGTFHKRFAQAVAILKSGQPLPPKAPE
jgi:hypothetical protein